MRMIEYPPEIKNDKLERDAIPEAACQHRLVVMLEIVAPLKATSGDQVSGIAFLLRHPRPNFGNEQADVVVHPDLRADKTGGGDKPVSTSEKITHKGRV